LIQSGGDWDVLVIGAGPAGIAAAVCARESGARVILIDEGPAPGGQIWRPGVRPGQRGLAGRWLHRLETSGVTVMRSTAAVDLWPAQSRGVVVLAEVRGGGFQIAAHTVVLATGARERFLPFPGWTLPNVFGVGAAQALLKGGLSVRGRRVIVAGTGPLVLAVAASLARAGATLELVAEQAPPGRVARFALGLWRTPSLLAQAAVYRAAFAPIAYSMGTRVLAAMGDSQVKSVTVTDGKVTREIACDFLCAAFGLVPNTELARLAGCSLLGENVHVDSSQATTVPNIYCAGEPTGVGGVELAIVEGEIAGRAAAGLTVDARTTAHAMRLRQQAARLRRAFSLPAEVNRMATPDTVLCRCEDVRLKDLNPNWTPRQAKLYTRVGMGTCQGRICGPALQSVMGWPEGYDTVRAPTQPARVSTLGSATLGTSSSERGAH
jgi:NADPH-dependent 2,4-dienoyl-CoA reductase/sulfur reductase-like enzyme